jgi:hypothetical protein
VHPKLEPDIGTKLLQHYTVKIERNGTFFVFSLIIEGTTKKVLQFIMPYKSIYNKNLGFIEQKNVFSNSTDRLKI